MGGYICYVSSWSIGLAGLCFSFQDLVGLCIGFEQWAGAYRGDLDGWDRMGYWQ